MKLLIACFYQLNFFESRFFRLSSLPAFFIIFALLSPFLSFLFLFQDLSWKLDFDFPAVVGMTFFSSRPLSFFSFSFRSFRKLRFIGVCWKKILLFIRGSCSYSRSHTSSYFSSISCFSNRAVFSFSFWTQRAYLCSSFNLHRALFCGCHEIAFKAGFFVG